MPPVQMTSKRKTIRWASSKHLDMTKKGKQFSGAITHHTKGKTKTMNDKERINYLYDQLTLLRSYLRLHGNHSDRCPKKNSMLDECTCGWDHVQNSGALTHKPLREMFGDPRKH
jgi:hypothetical protein